MLNGSIQREVAKNPESNVVNPAEDNSLLDLRNRLNISASSPNFGVRLSESDVELLVTTFEKEQEFIAPEQKDKLNLTVEGIKQGFSNLVSRPAQGMIEVNLRQSLIQKVMGAFRRK